MPETNQTKWRGIRPVSPAENIPVDITVNSAGTINVAEQVKTGYSAAITTPTGLNNVDTYTGTAGDSFTTSQAFADTCYEVIVISETNGSIVQLSRDGTNWSDDIIVPANVIMSLTIKATHWKIKNRTAGSNSTYTVSGVYLV